MTRPKTEVDLDKLLAGDRAALARAITLVESKRADHRAAARRAARRRLMPATGKAVRVGITGVPGVGKSTSIDALGIEPHRRGPPCRGAGRRPDLDPHRRLDPRRQDPHGAARRRPERLHPALADRRARSAASPRKTRETMLLCEAAGFDVMLVETVGVGQSETAVADMVDFFLVLMLPGAGDELQGIKKGMLEIADMIAVNKADGDNVTRAKAAAAEYRAALHILTPASPTWSPPVVTVSGLANEGLDELWAKVLDHRARLTATGEIERKRRAQDRKWMWALVDERLRARLAGDAAHRQRMRRIEQAVARGTMSPAAGADEIAALLAL